MKKDLKIGQFGYGVVGQGVYDIITNNKNIQAEIVKICAKHPDKPRNISMDHFTFDKKDILQRDDLDIIVELIDDPEAAFEIVSESLKKGINVVTSNKKMVAEHMEELLALQMENRASLLYEASACSSIPILRTLEEYYDNDLVESINGVFNGSTNYILTKIFKHNQDYDIAVKQAQDLGFAESNPSLDIGGFDAAYKLAIVAFHAFGTFIDPKKIVTHSIQYISRYDIQFAQEKGAIIKQVATAMKVDDNKIMLYCLPQFVYPGSKLYDVNYEYNGVVVDTAYSEDHFYYGKGAGGHPTGFAVMSDISALRYDYKYEYKKHLQNFNIEITEEPELEVYLRFYDKKNLEHFNFSSITGEYKSKEFNYVTGYIKLKELLAKQSILQTADILLVATGNIK